MSIRERLIALAEKYRKPLKVEGVPQDAFVEEYARFRGISYEAAKALHSENVLLEETDARLGGREVDTLAEEQAHAALFRVSSEEKDE